MSNRRAKGSVALDTPTEFSIGEDIVCVHAADNYAYEARVIDIKEHDGVKKYVVHFMGWNSRYDKKVALDETEGVMFKGTLAEYHAKHGKPEVIIPAKKKTAASVTESPVPAQKPINSKFKVDEVITCLQETRPYEAKVMQILNDKGVPHYVVHFKGWHVRYDEWIPVGEEDGKMFKETLKEYKEKYGDDDEHEIPIGRINSNSSTGSSVAERKEAPKTEDAKQPKPIFAVNDSLVYYDGKQAYSASIREIKEEKGVQKYFIHLIGFNPRHDIMVDVGKEEGVLFKGTLEEYHKENGGEVVSPRATKKRTAASLEPETSAKGETEKSKVLTAQKGSKVVAPGPETPIAENDPEEEPEAEFEAGENIICLQGNEPYIAKVVAIRRVNQQMVYIVHYMGFNKRHDITVPFKEAKGRMYKGSLEEFQANQAIATLRAAQQTEEKEHVSPKRARKN
uniref:Tudor-knot domain-containing protein n=1 Tax=Caenorhabditis tropicalis TaxID=1561998 RepID=A0A1I7TTM1_9PELO